MNAVICIWMKIADKDNIHIKNVREGFVFSGLQAGVWAWYIE
jgi:hypothetical protein